MAKNAQKPSRLGAKKGGASIGGGTFIGEFTVFFVCHELLSARQEIWEIRSASTLMPYILTTPFSLHFIAIVKIKYCTFFLGHHYLLKMEH